MALANREYVVSEVAQIDRILAATFDLKPLEAAKLRATCEALERHAKLLSKLCVARGLLSSQCEESVVDVL